MRTSNEFIILSQLVEEVLIPQATLFCQILSHNQVN